MSEMIEVGDQRNGSGNKFIAFPDKLYDMCKSQITHEVKHVMRIPKEDLKWLIEALKKENGEDYDTTLAGD